MEQGARGWQGTHFRIRCVTHAAHPIRRRVGRGSHVHEPARGHNRCVCGPQTRAHAVLTNAPCLSPRAPADYSAFLELMKDEARDAAERAERDAEDSKEGGDDGDEDEGKRESKK